MVLARRTWSGLAAALPALLISLRYFDVFLHPAAGNNAEWAADAQFVVKLEFLLIFISVITAWIASQATVSDRATRMAVLAAVFGAIGYGLWIATDGSIVIPGVGLLIAGRFAAAVIAGPEAATGFTERAVVGIVFYAASVFIAFALTEMLPPRYGFHLEHPAAAFCAFYFLLLALVEAAHIYIGTPLAASRRPTVRLGASEALTQTRLLLRFAGDAFEVVSYERWRAAGRILGFFTGTVPVGIGLGIFIRDRISRRAKLDPNILPEYFAIFMLALGAFLIYRSLRKRASTSILQVRPGGLAKLELSSGKLDKCVELSAAEVSFDVLGTDGPGITLAINRKGDVAWGLMYVDSGLADPAAAESLKNLFEIYMSGDPSPRGLRKAFDADRGIPALLGPEVVERLLEAPPMPVREGTIACPECKNEIAASAHHCGYCGMLYPALEN